MKLGSGPGNEVGQGPGNEAGRGPGNKIGLIPQKLSQHSRGAGTVDLH